MAPDAVGPEAKDGARGGFWASGWPDAGFLVCSLLWSISTTAVWHDLANYGGILMCFFAPVGLMLPLWTAARVRIEDAELRRSLLRRAVVVAGIWVAAFLVCLAVPLLGPKPPETWWVLLNPLAVLVAFLAAAEALHRWAWQGAWDAMRRMRREPPEQGIPSGAALRYLPRAFWWGFALFVWASETWFLVYAVVITLRH